VAAGPAGRRKRWYSTVSTALPRISTPHIRVSPVVGVACSSTPRMVGPSSTMRSRTRAGSKRPSSTSTNEMMRNGPPPPGSDGGPRKSISIVSCSATGIVRPAAWTRPASARASRTTGRRVKRATIVSARLGSSSPRARRRSGSRRTTLSRPVVTLASPSSTAALRTVEAGRTKASNSWVAPGRGSKAFAPCATTGTITLPARRIASASAPSSARCASKKIAKATTRGAAGRRASSASA